MNKMAIADATCVYATAFVFRVGTTLGTVFNIVPMLFAVSIRQPKGIGTAGGSIERALLFLSTILAKRTHVSNTTHDYDGHPPKFEQMTVCIRLAYN